MEIVPYFDNARWKKREKIKFYVPNGTKVLI
jgi:sRNA-binding regulator protein Hfq